ncbi:site-2 protease family protein [Candidatus Peregrinibacteria bacterium]|nr:site-2 protease family protein [Candidatus Peregrinibacteria bacterium]
MEAISFLFFLVALIIVLTVHEASHALAAYYLGDPTAKMKGRLTLNPIPHLDPVGSIVFILTQRIGWGKPVPINPANFKKPLRDSALTALAGPMSNFVLAFIIVLPWKYLGEYMPDILLVEIQYIFHVSIFLGIFNLFPLPPLDGSKILGLVIPKAWYRGYQRYLIHGGKYFVAIILIDVFILGGIFGFSFFHFALSYLHNLISTVLLLGT